MTGLSGIVRAIGAVAVIAVVAGCSTGHEVKGAGANPSQAGPRANATTIVPPQRTPVPKKTKPAAARTPTTPLGKLEAALQFRLAAGGRQSVGVLAEQYGGAGTTVLVRWTISNDATDKTAKLQARHDVTTILTAIKHSTLTYPTVLLIGTATVSGLRGTTTVAKVIRAKYSVARIKATNFAAHFADLYTLTDGPAELYPSFR